MAKNKNQHFVPKCYMKPFSYDSEGKCINLYNLKSGKFVQDASTKYQCSRNYFYGKNLALENSLKELEHQYGVTISKLKRNGIINADDRFFLRSFSFLQHMRTEEKIRTFQMMATEFNEIISNKGSIEAPTQDEGHENSMLLAMKIFASTHYAIEDLKVCICMSNSDNPFFTSDNPSIFTSKFQMQRLNEKAFGLTSAGIFFCLPLSPHYLAIIYDGDVYTIPNRNHFIKLKQQDVNLLNEMQFLNASNNIYFSDWSDRSKIKDQYTAIKNRRPEVRYRLNTLKPLGNRPDSEERYVNT